MTVTSVISSGLEANSLLCAVQANGTRQKTHSAANRFTSSSGILTIYQLPGMDMWRWARQEGHREKLARTASFKKIETEDVQA
jgi:hypothetical protein